jgi:hypothetical protein
VTSWLEPLIDPHELVVSARRGNRDVRAALALLLSGEILAYERSALESAWPRLGSRPRRGAPPEERLLVAVGLHLTGSQSVSAVYEGLTEPASGDTSFATVSAVLSSLYYAGRAQDDEALQVLHEALRRASTPLEEVLLELHIGVREAERGNIDAAIDSTERAGKARIRAGRRQHFRALQVIAQHNVFAYRQYGGRLTDPSRLPVRASELPLVRADIATSVGLAKHLDDEFDQVTRDPGSRSIVWRAEDPVETPLQGALLRAECLADWIEQRRARALLGRYHVVSKLGTREGVAPAAFELLRLAGDGNGLREAARSVAAVGPLGALRGETKALLQHPWPQTQRAPILALLSGGADLLQPRDADRALKRLASAPNLIVTDPFEGLRAFARLVAVASDRAQTSASRFARSLSDEHPQAATLQRMGQVVEALRWPAVSAAERRRWIAYIDEHILVASDARFLAERTAGALVHAERDAVGPILVEAYVNAPNPDRLALLVDAEIQLPRQLRFRAAKDVAQALDKIREDAHRGKYGMGGVDIALLMLSLVRRQANHSGWETLIDFLLDERVGVEDKTRALDQLASPNISIPSRIKHRLRASADSIRGFAYGLGGSATSLRGAALRLWLRLGGPEPDELLSQLLELAGDLDREGRREAALTLPAAQRRLGNDIAFTLALTLTRDRDFSVRAQAARSLARLRPDGPGELRALASRRVESLLAEPGTEVPYWTLGGLLEAQRAGQEIPKTVFEEVVRVRRSHPSRRLQRVAELLLDRT